MQVLRVVVNNQVASNLFLNSFFTSMSSIMLRFTSSVTDEFMVDIYQLCDNSSCNSDSLSHQTFQLAIIK